jgi:hypothetical protein
MRLAARDRPGALQYAVDQLEAQLKVSVVACSTFCPASLSRDLTRSTEARYHAPVPTVVMRPVLWEVADIVEQIFRIAATCDLRDLTPEDREAAIHAYRAMHDLTVTRLRDALRSSLTAIQEVRELSHQAKLMRNYARCLRPLVPEGGVRRGRRRVQRIAPTDSDTSPMLAIDRTRRFPNISLPSFRGSAMSWTTSIVTAMLPPHSR